MPVIYHDFSLSETGTDIPIHDLSLEQSSISHVVRYQFLHFKFMYASKVQSPSGNPASVLGKGNLQATWAESDRGKPRSRSVTRGQEGGAHEVQDRMKHTVDFMNKGFKPNTRGDSIHDSFTTLEELLMKLPKSISFNVEINTLEKFPEIVKAGLIPLQPEYPRLHEAVDAGVAPVAIELNTFIDIALDKIYRFGSDRTIILSYFTPEVCILLSIKQQAYPVMFITNADERPLIDMEMRAGSLQVAVRFAKRWNLAGIVSASEPLFLCPRLVKYVKHSGLSCGSYGLVNNVPENAKVSLQLLRLCFLRHYARTAIVE